MDSNHRAGFKPGAGLQPAAFSRSATYPQTGTPGRSRTYTGWGLNPSPLPIGLQGLTGSLPEELFGSPELCIRGEQKKPRRLSLRGSRSLSWVAYLSRRTTHFESLRLPRSKRISEAQNAKWSDIKGDKWEIPENKSNRKNHFCILAPQALEIINGLERVDGSDMIFHHKGTRFPATNVQAWLRRWLDKHKISPRYTPHDLRRTMRTRLGELGIDFVVAEKILNHSLGGVLQIYDRSVKTDERRAAMCAWADKVSEITADTR